MNKHLQTFLLGTLTTLLFSAFIYCEHYGYTNKILNTIFGLSAITLFLYIPKRSVLIAGFLIGILWFYWIGYSFEYQGVGYMSPIITFAFGIIYLLFFLPLYFTNKAYVRALFLFALSFFEPFDWNWLQIELLFIESYIGIYKYQLLLVLVALSSTSLIHNRYKYLPLLLIIPALNFGYPKQELSDLKIKLVQTDIKQAYKWKREAIKPTVAMIFNEIESAIEQKYDLIILPESVFPLYLNHNPQLISKLKKFSQNISIVAGALLRENEKNYNVSYFFENGDYTIAKKLVLVPFGEYIPLPKFAQKIINDTFFQGTSDFVTASKPTNFIIKGVKFRNAICYEATCEELYTGDFKFMIATSNNAWFRPSIEPTIQNLLLRYYAHKNGVTIYHSANWSGSGIIR